MKALSALLLLAMVLSDWVVVSGRWQDFMGAERQEYRRNRMEFNQRAVPLLQSIADDLGHAAEPPQNQGPAGLRVVRAQPDGSLATVQYLQQGGSVVRVFGASRTEFPLQLRQIEFTRRAPQSWDVVFYREVETRYGPHGLDFVTFTLGKRPAL